MNAPGSIKVATPRRLRDAPRGGIVRADLVEGAEEKEISRMGGNAENSKIEQANQHLVERGARQDDAEWRETAMRNNIENSRGRLETQIPRRAREDHETHPGPAIITPHPSNTSSDELQHSQKVPITSKYSRFSTVFETDDAQQLRKIPARYQTSVATSTAEDKLGPVIAPSSSSATSRTWGIFCFFFGGVFFFP